MKNEPVAWMQTFTQVKDGVELVKHAVNIEQVGINDIPLYTHPHPDNLGLAESIIKQQELQIEALKAHSVKELNDGGEPVKNATYWKRQYNLMATQNDNLKSGLYHANEQIKYLESHPVEEQDESFDRTASHMAGEYVAYQKELTDELNNLKKENKFFKEILLEMDKQVYNIEFLKQPMQILEDGQIMPVFKELTDEEIEDECRKAWGLHDQDQLNLEEVFKFARAILRKAQEKC